MNRYKIIIEYDGTHFNGWQIQPDARTVEGVIEQAFSILFQEKIDIAGQGRTDTGVHARAQVAHVDLPDKFHAGKIISAMNSLLPEDVTLLDIKMVNSDFHARFDALSRTYNYQIIQRRSSLMRNMTWHIYKKIEKKLLEECAGILIGEHDFINFCIPSESEYQTTICHISESYWFEKEEMFIYQITGNRFLRHMVRRLVGNMIKVASGEQRLSDFSAMLSKDEVIQKGLTAPAKGLCLEKVIYHTEE